MRVQRSTLIVALVIMAGLLAANFLIQIGVDPSYHNMGTDSGTFAYCGEVIHQGGLMYRDCWDNKPPGVYYLNAAAILLGGNNPFAIWLFQAVWLAIAVLVFFLIMLSIWEHLGLAALGSFTLLLVVLYPGIFQGGNFTETYAILPVVLSIGALWAYLCKGKVVWLVVLGLLLAAGFLLKPTYIAIGLSAGILIVYLHFRRRAYKRLLVEGAIFAASALLPVALVGVYFVLRQDFANLWFAVFTHNFSYVEQGLSLRSLYGTARMFLIDQPLASLTILVVVSGGLLLSRHARMIFSFKKPGLDEQDSFLAGRMGREQAKLWLMSAVFLSLIIDLAFLAASGKNFGHYVQVLLPGMSMAVVSLAEAVWRSMQKERFNRTMQLALLSAIVVIFLGGGLEMAGKETPSLQNLKAFISEVNTITSQHSQLEQYIIDHSSPDSSVLVWALHPGMNFVTQRRSPTRYIFLPHIFSPTPSGPNGFTELIGELQADPPELIAVQRDLYSNLPYYGDPNDYRCSDCDGLIKAGLAKLNEYVTTNYRLVNTIWDWEIYQRIP